jgi:hypothetical protein
MSLNNISYIHLVTHATLRLLIIMDLQKWTWFGKNEIYNGKNICIMYANSFTSLQVQPSMIHFLTRKELRKRMAMLSLMSSTILMVTGCPHFLYSLLDSSQRKRSKNYLGQSIQIVTQLVRIHTSSTNTSI